MNRLPLTPFWPLLAVFMLSWGCQQSLPPRPIIVIQPGLTNSVELTINGQSPQDSPVSLARGAEIEVLARYTRPSQLPASFQRTVLHFVPVNRRQRISAESGLGNVEDEKVQGEVRVWECRWVNGIPGRKIKLMRPPGEYDVVLCWQRNRVTIADEVAYNECPLNLATPIFQTRIIIVDENSQ